MNLTKHFRRGASSEKSHLKSSLEKVLTSFRTQRSFWLGEMFKLSVSVRMLDGWKFEMKILGRPCCLLVRTEAGHKSEWSGQIKY